MNTGDLLSESEWEIMLHRDPDVDTSAWNYGTNLIDEFFAPEAPFWVETNNNGELIASDFQSQFNGHEGGGGVDTGGGSSGMQIDNSNGIDFMPTRSSSEVLDAVVSTNQQSSPPASLDPALLSPSVAISDSELLAAEKAEISNMSSSRRSVICGENDHDLTMEDLLPSVCSMTTPTVGREGAQTLPYGTDGTAGHTPHSAQQSLPQVPENSSNALSQTLRATPNMAATSALYSSSPYQRGRHTQSTDGAESLRRDMEQQATGLPARTAAIPFSGLKPQNTPSPMQETAEEEESTVTLSKPRKKRAHASKSGLKTEAATLSTQETSKVTQKRANTRQTVTKIETTTSSAQETVETNEPDGTPAKLTKTRKPKAAIEDQMFAVVSTSNNGAQAEKLAKGSELGFASPAPKRSHKRKVPLGPVLQESSKKLKVRNPVSSREVRLLTGKEMKEDKRRKTRASVKAGGEIDDGPDAGKAVRQRRQAKK